MTLKCQYFIDRGAQPVDRGVILCRSRWDYALKAMSTVENFWNLLCRDKYPNLRRSTNWNVTFTLWLNLWIALWIAAFFWDFSIDLLLKRLGTWLERVDACAWAGTNLVASEIDSGYNFIDAEIYWSHDLHLIRGFRYTLHIKVFDCYQSVISSMQLFLTLSERK